MTWSSCASVNAIGAIGLACSNAGIGSGVRELADRLGTAAAAGIPFLDERARDPGPTILRPPGRRAREPCCVSVARLRVADTAGKSRLARLLVTLSPLRYQLGQVRFGPFRHLKPGYAFLTETVRLRHSVFVRPPFFRARSRTCRSHDLI